LRPLQELVNKILLLFFSEAQYFPSIMKEDYIYKQAGQMNFSNFMTKTNCSRGFIDKIMKTNGNSAGVDTLPKQL
jgi:hypothetical protein